MAKLLWDIEDISALSRKGIYVLFPIFNTSYGFTFQNLSKSAYWQNGYQYV